MKDIIIDDSVIGKLIYRKDNWRRINPVNYSFNGEERNIEIEIDILAGEATEYELGIGNWEEEDFDDDELTEHREYKEQVRYMYKKYIGDFEETLKLIEKIIREDYDEFISKTTKDDIVKIIGKENYKIINKNNSNIINLVELDKVTIFDKRVRIIGRCKWYVNNEFGINFWKDGKYSVGNLDTIY
ncbi:hypothetical protein [Clostridium sp. CTA-5]